MSRVGPDPVVVFDSHRKSLSNSNCEDGPWVDSASASHCYGCGSSDVTGPRAAGSSSASRRKRRIEQRRLGNSEQRMLLAAEPWSRTTWQKKYVAGAASLGLERDRRVTVWGMFGDGSAAMIRSRDGRTLLNRGSCLPEMLICSR